MNKIASLLVALSMILLLVGCGNNSSANVTKYEATKSQYSIDDVQNALVNSVGSTDIDDGRPYSYSCIATYEYDKDTYYVFRQDKIKIVDDKEIRQTMNYYFVSYDGTKAYKGTYNEDSAQAQFKDSINISLN